MYKASEISLNFWGFLFEKKGLLLLEINARRGISIQIANGEGSIGRLEAIEEALPKLSEMNEKIEFAKRAFATNR